MDSVIQRLQFQIRQLYLHSMVHHHAVCIIYQISQMIYVVFWILDFLKQTPINWIYFHSPNKPFTFLICSICNSNIYNRSCYCSSPYPYDQKTISLKPLLWCRCSTYVFNLIPILLISYHITSQLTMNVFKYYILV